MAIIKQFDKRSGITYVYDSKSYYDKEKNVPEPNVLSSVNLIPIPGDTRPYRWAEIRVQKSKPNSISPEIDKDKRIQELEYENRQLKLQISALKKELERIQTSN